jgi:hypothetical protein
MFLTNFFLYWGPKYYNEIFKESKISNGYTLYANVLYHIRPFGFKSIVNILLNIILILFILISYSFCFTTGFLGSIMGLVWMIVSLIYNIFVIPILNIGCFLSVISDHTWLITIMLCISVALSSRGNLPPTITGILGGFVALLILLQTYQNISK